MDFYAIRPLSLCHIWGAYFLLIWGLGLVDIVFRHGCFCQGGMVPLVL